MGAYELKVGSSILNAFISTVSMIIVYSWKGYGFTTDNITIPIIVISVLSFVIFGILGCCYFLLKALFKIDGSPGQDQLLHDLVDTENLKHCIEHNLEFCVICTRKYGFFVENYKTLAICKDHDKAPYEYESDIDKCELEQCHTHHWVCVKIQQWKMFPNNKWKR